MMVEYNKIISKFVKDNDDGEHKSSNQCRF